MNYYELSPAYGRDYKSAKEAKSDWEAGKDFVGDYQLNFAYVSKRDIPKPCSVILRYKRNTSLTVVKVA